VEEGERLLVAGHVGDHELEQTKFDLLHGDPVTLRAG
jgi:hypothetical protein